MAQKQPTAPKPQPRPTALPPKPHAKKVQHIHFCTWSDAPEMQRLLAERDRTIDELCADLHLSRQSIYRILATWQQHGLARRKFYRKAYRYSLTRRGRNAYLVYCQARTVQYCKALIKFLDPFQGHRVGAIARLLGLRWNTAKSAANVLVSAGIAESVDRLYYLNEAFQGKVAP